MTLSRRQLFRGLAGAGLTALALPRRAYPLGGSLSLGLGGGFAPPAGGGGGEEEDLLLTDTNHHAEPTLPTLPAAGGEFTDPVFGSRILRVTDASTEPDTGAPNGAVNAYSTQASFNADNTRLGFLVRASYTRFRVFTFDPVNFTINTTGALLASPPAGLQEYGMCWHPSNANLIYGVGNYNLYEINWSTGISTTLKTFTGLGHSSGYITQMNMSTDGDVFAMRFEGGSPAGSGYVFWRRSTDTVIKSAATLANLDEVEIDKSGQYGIIVYNSGGGAEVWDLTGTPALIASGLSFNHRDCGSDGIFTHRPTNNSLGYRTCAAPTTITDLLPTMSNGWSYSGVQDHFSMQGLDTWAVASRYRTDGGAAAAAFQNEIVMVKTDGSGAVRRVCHTRPGFGSYYDSQFASPSFDSKFIAWSSKYGQTTRHDAFITKIPAGSL